jgi:hypothetical protein
VTGWLVLYLRSRRAPLSLSLSVGAVALVAVAWTLLAGRRDVNPELSVLTVALALAPLIPTLATHDPVLERTAALPWPPRRALHLIACGAVVVALLLAARVGGPDFGPVGQVIRNTAGLIGLIGLGAALAGAPLAWPVPFVWTAAQAILVLPDGPIWRQTLLWLVQPAGNTTAAITAAALFAAGVASYSMRVGPPVSPAEAELGQ